MKHPAAVLARPPNAPPGPGSDPHLTQVLRVIRALRVLRSIRTLPLFRELYIMCLGGPTDGPVSRGRRTRNGSPWFSGSDLVPGDLATSGWGGPVLFVFWMMMPQKMGRHVVWLGSAGNGLGVVFIFFCPGFLNQRIQDKNSLAAFVGAFGLLAQAVQEKQQSIDFEGCQSQSARAFSLHCFGLMRRSKTGRSAPGFMDSFLRRRRSLGQQSPGRWDVGMM